MRYSDIVVGIVLIVGVINGCATAPTGAAPDPTVNVSGRWTGTTRVGTNTVLLSLTLAQTGATVTGEYAVAGSANLTGAIVGTVTGNEFSFRLTSGHGGADLVVNGDDMAGVGRTSGARLIFHRQK